MNGEYEPHFAEAGEMSMMDAPRRRDEDEERCCGTCAHCGADYPLDPQDLEVYYCRIRPIDCPEIDAAYEMVDLDDVCERYVPEQDEDQDEDQEDGE